jgi:pimeloyl-ACP methyl ester carboxylesterase
VTAAERMAGLLAHATVAIVEGAGHTVHLERPDEFSDLLDEWLAASSFASGAQIYGDGGQ